MGRFGYKIPKSELIWANLSGCMQGSFPVRKRTGTLRIWRARGREPIWGSGDGAPSGVQGQSPWSEAEGILLPKGANLSLSFK